MSRVSLTFSKEGLLLAGLLVLTQCLFYYLDLPLSYHRGAIQSGEYWRLVSGHGVHLSWMHLALNAAAAYLVIELFNDAFSKLRLWSYCFALMLLISAGMYWFVPELRNYLGFSAVLHGLLLLGCYYSRHLPPWLRLAVACGVIGKVIYEQTPWYQEAPVAALIGGPVAETSHLLGVLAALVWIFLHHLGRRLR